MHHSLKSTQKECTKNFSSLFSHLNFKKVNLQKVIYESIENKLGLSPNKVKRFLYLTISAITFFLLYF